MKLFDAHLHIIDPRYPLVANQGFVPEPFAVEDYLKQLNGIDLQGGTIVSGSFQGFDQSYLIDALQHLDDNYFGVANIPMGMTKEELSGLNDAGVRGVRFNLYRGCQLDFKEMEQLSLEVFNEYGWHAEFYLDSSDIPELLPVLKRMPKISIDHLGMRKDGLNFLYSLAENGVQIKATGFGRLDFDPMPVMQKLYTINPSALMFGTDLPSTRAVVPFSLNDIELIKSGFGEEEQERIFYRNANEWYGNML